MSQPIGKHSSIALRVDNWTSNGAPSLGTAPLTVHQLARLRGHQSAVDSCGSAHTALLGTPTLAQPRRKSRRNKPPSAVTAGNGSLSDHLQDQA
jgi:hypothetical protein